MGVDEDTYQWMFGSCVKFRQSTVVVKWKDLSTVHFIVRYNWVILLSEDCFLSQ